MALSITTQYGPSNTLTEYTMRRESKPALANENTQQQPKVKRNAFPRREKKISSVVLMAYRFIRRAREGEHTLI